MFNNCFDFISSIRSYLCKHNKNTNTNTMTPSLSPTDSISIYYVSPSNSISTPNKRITPNSSLSSLKNLSINSTFGSSNSLNCSTYYYYDEENNHIFVQKITINKY